MTKTERTVPRFDTNGTEPTERRIKLNATQATLFLRAHAAAKNAQDQLNIIGAALVASADITTCQIVGLDDATNELVVRVSAEPNADAL